MATDAQVGPAERVWQKLLQPRGESNLIPS